MVTFKKVMLTVMIIIWIIVAGILSYICILLISECVIEKVSESVNSSKVDDNVRKYSSPEFEPERIKVQCVENNLVAILVSSSGTARAMIPILNADGTPKMCEPVNIN